MSCFKLLGEAVVVTGAMTERHGSMVIETSPPGRRSAASQGNTRCSLRNNCGNVRAGEVAFLPGGSLHTFRNAGRETGKVALSFYPSGFEEFFGELAEGLDAGNFGERSVQAGGRLRCYFRAGTDLSLLD